MSVFMRTVMRKSLLVLWVGVSLGGCIDPCQQLAERICACELTESQRNQCRQERITNQRDFLVADTDAQEACVAALETCTCTALDQNRTDLCGFTADAPEET